MRWVASVWRGCNIGGGEVILKIFPGWRSPWLSFNNNRKKVEYRQEEPKGVGGEEEEELSFFSRRFIVSNWSLCLVGCFSPSVVTSPYLWPDARFWTSSKKVKVNLRWRQSEVFDFHTKLHESESYVDSFLFVYVCSFVWLLSSVLDKESVDSKVLVQIEINQIQKYSLDCSKKR